MRNYGKCIIKITICLVLLNGYLKTQDEQWVSAYYAGWSQGWHDNGVLPSSNIDFNGVTHIIHFALVPKSDGTLDDQSNSVHESNAKAIVEKTHAAGKKILICVGGWGTNIEFRNATSLLNRSTFISNLVKVMQDRGYDGIDIDWEPLELSDLVQYTAFITELRLRLNQISPNLLLTAATSWQAPIFALIASEFDQINLMTYDLSGAWPGWVSWHNSPLLDGGFRFASTGRLVPSADNMIDEFILAGVPKNKLGIGVDFYGYIWSGGSGTPTGGVTEPRQSWSSPPQIQVNVPYYSLMQGYYAPQYYRWDSSAQAAYISVDKPGSSDDKFITYDNEMTCRMKMEYSKNKGIGGIIIWELGGGMLPDKFSNRDRLLKTIKQSLTNDTLPPQSSIVTMNPTNFARGVPLRQTLQWTASDDASWYHIQIAHDSLFTSPVVDQYWLIEPTYITESLPPDTTYYWRIQSSNAFASGPWSPISFFGTAKDSLMPPSWLYISNTGENATVLIPSTLIPKIGNRSLQNGDLIGAFFLHNNKLTCAGYSQWEQGKSTAITIWGDNLLTVEKEGFGIGDTIYFKFWERKYNRESIAVPVFSSGGNTYSSDGIFVLESLAAQADTKQLIPLDEGWNMISSYISPNNPSIESITSSINGNFILIKDNAGNVFIPDSNINMISTWDFKQGYQIFMRSSDTLEMIGEAVTPESTLISLNTGWNMIAYLRSNPMAPDSALKSVHNNITLVKNNHGEIYWPEFGIKTLQEMLPEQGYKISMKRNDTLIYPPNNLSFASSALSELQGKSSESATVPQKIYPRVAETGANMVLLVESSEIEEGDEVGAWTLTKTLVGSGIARKGKCVVVVWGKDSHTNNSIGATVNEHITLTIWQQALKRESKLILTSLKNVITNNDEGTTLKYADESIMIATAKSVPVAHYLEQNFPNPFNSSTTILFGLSTASKVHLNIYNALGQFVTQLANGNYSAGQYRVTFRSARLASGMYFCRLQAGKFVQVIKMLLLK